MSTPKLKDFGWANAGGAVAEAIDILRHLCREKGHQPTDIDVGPPMRGIEHVVSCVTCGYVYRYDSSD